MEEDKRAIVQKLKELLQITREGSGVRDLILDGREKCVTIVYPSPHPWALPCVGCPPVTAA